MDCHTGYRSFFFFKLLVAAVARAMQYAHRPPDPTMPVSGCLREINMRFDSLLLIEFLPCTRRRKYFAVLLKWKAGHIVLYFLCVWAKLFDGSGCFSSCEVIRRWKMKNEAIRSVGYVMIICMQGNSNLNLSKYIFFSPPYSLWGLYIAFPMFYICFRFVCNRHWREVLFWSVRQYGGINLDILKIWQFHKAIIISVARHPKVFFCVDII